MMEWVREMIEGAMEGYDKVEATGHGLRSHIPFKCSGPQETIGERLRARRNFISQEILDATDACCVARLAGDQDLHRSQLKSSKAAGTCSIPAELLKAGGEPMVQGLHVVLNATWLSGTNPPDLLRDHLLRHQQSGFTPSKSTIDRTLALQVITERRRAFRRGLLAAYIDLKKAFDMFRSEARLCLCTYIFHTCMDWILGRATVQSHCGASLDNIKVTNLDFDDALLSESLESLVVALNAFSNEAKSFDLEVSWTKTKIQDLGDLLQPVQLVRACGTDIEVTESFTYLGSVVHNSGLSDQEISRLIGLTKRVMNSHDKSIWRCRRTKLRVFKVLIVPVLLYGPCVGSWGTVGLTHGPAQSVIANSGFMATWLASLRTTCVEETHGTT
ncbi:uncharacterized protein [Penaeus vannamei]|uniref:uncharacterized protein n=1 Tax=Penaeus vannamei TaxID=6689 RepID=UPI00387F791B